MEILEKLKTNEIPLLVFSDVTARELDGFGQVDTRPQSWQKREPSACGLTDVPVPDHLGTGPEDASRERELRERLDEAIERLTTRQRTALHLRAVEGLDYNGIAEILGGSAAAARMLVLAAREQIMRRMGRHLEP